jgi:beta-lactamase regulating signal transducer with metallopeptidase domain
MNALLFSLGWTLLHFLWQGLLLALLVGLALWALTGQDSRLRYAVACLGLLAMLAAPSITFVRLRAGPPAPIAVPSESPAPRALTRAKTEAAVIQGPSWHDRVNAVLPLLVLAWGCGCLLLSLRLAGGWVWLQWMRRHPDTHPAPDAEQLLLLRLCQRMGVGSNLRLLLCEAVPGPTVMGWLKPVILIPPALLLGLSPQQLELILAHELAHVLRHDYFVNLLQSVAEVLFFFHPAVWWVSKKIRQEREQASDDLAVRLCGDALDYAQALTALEALASVVRSSHPPPRLALGAHGGDFMSRIHRLISPTPTTSLAPRAGLVILLLLGGVLALQARTRNASPTPAAQETPLPEGTVRLRRYDVDGPGRKAGTIDMRVEHATLATIEFALARLKNTPPDLPAGFVDLTLRSVPKTPDALKAGVFSYKFSGVDPTRVLTIVRAQAARAPIEKKPDLLVIQRINAFTYEGGLLPKGLNVDVWAGDVPADLILEALNELEAMRPEAGIPQEVRREILPGMGKGPRIRMDVQGTDPLLVRDILETTLAKAKQ